MVNYNSTWKTQVAVLRLVYNNVLYTDDWNTTFYNELQPTSYTTDALVLYEIIYKARASNQNLEILLIPMNPAPKCNRRINGPGNNKMITMKTCGLTRSASNSRIRWIRRGQRLKRDLRSYIKATLSMYEAAKIYQGLGPVETSWLMIGENMN